MYIDWISTYVDVAINGIFKNCQLHKIIILRKLIIKTFLTLTDSYSRLERSTTLINIVINMIILSRIIKK